MSTHKWSVDFISAQLEKVYCGGKIPQTTLGEGLEVEAVSEDRSLIVQWEGASQANLPQAIGVMDLKLLIRSLSQMGQKVTIYLDNYRLVLDGENRSSVRLIIGDPEQIPTTIPEGVMNQIDEMFSTFPVFDVPAEALKRVATTQNILRSGDTPKLSLEVSPDGATFVVGSGTENIGQVEVPEIKADSSYELNLPAETFSNVVQVLYEDSDVRVRLSGPESLIELSQSKIRYIISPVADNE